MNVHWWEWTSWTVKTVKPMMQELEQMVASLRFWVSVREWDKGINEGVGTSFTARGVVDLRI